MFLIWGLIGICIIIGVIWFYSTQADTRVSQANVLAMRVLDCLGNNFNYLELNDLNFDIYSKCGLNKKVVQDSDLYYFNLTILDYDSRISLKSFLVGDGTFEFYCNYNKLERNFAQCSSKFLLVTDRTTGKNYVLNIKAASNQK